MFRVVQRVCFCKGHFVIVPLHLTLATFVSLNFSSIYNLTPGLGRICNAQTVRRAQKCKWLVISTQIFLPVTVNFMDIHVNTFQELHLDATIISQNGYLTHNLNLRNKQFLPLSSTRMLRFNVRLSFLFDFIERSL